MPRIKSPTTDKERSPPRQPHLSLARNVTGIAADAPPHRQPIQSSYSVSGPSSTPSQPTYSETILQRPTLAIDPSTLPPQSAPTDPSSATSRRLSTSSMRNASMTFENVTSSQTPTGRISKAKKGKRVHTCEFPGCGKVFTRAEHRRRHELNHNPESVFKCDQPGCSRSFHRLDLLQRHQERHESEASPSLSQASPRNPSNVFTSPPSIIPSNNLSSPQAVPVSRTSAGSVPIGSLVNPQSQYCTFDTPLPFDTTASQFTQAVNPYYYGSDRSHSPVSDHFGLPLHGHTISSASSDVAFEPRSMSPIMTTSLPGNWIPAIAPPPLDISDTAFPPEQAGYLQSNTVNTLSVHRFRELDGHEYDALRSDLSTVPGLVFDPDVPESYRYIRSDCLELYWNLFHPAFPVVYKPSFITDSPPPLLLYAMIAIGSSYDLRPDAQRYSLALQEIATKLLQQRDETVTNRSRIADLQTVLLLEVLSKYSARRAQPQTSSRFRAMFATLHHTKSVLAQNPLAVLRTLTQDKTDDDLKRAHKFWLDHEARRRIFYACSVLDAQQIALFGQKPTVITHKGTSNGPISYTQEVNLPCDEALWAANTLEEWFVKGTNSTPQDVASARLNYHAASVKDYSFFQHQIINLNNSSAQRCHEGLSSPVRQNRPVSKTNFNYHIFQMTKNVPIRSLLIVAGESWFLGKKIEQEAEYIQSKHVIREWTARASMLAGSNEPANSLKAHWHATRVLRMLFGSTGNAYYFRTTNMLHEDWSTYLAALVCWAHGHSRAHAPHATFQQAILSPKASRKRKFTESDTPSRKRKVAMLSSSSNLLAPSTTMHTTNMPSLLSTSPSDDTDWSAYGPVPKYNDRWAAYNDQSMILSTYQHQHPTRADPGPSTKTASGIDSSAYDIRTATNTPQSQISLMTTAPTSMAPTDRDDSMAELCAYLIATDVPSIPELAGVDSHTLTRTKGVLEAVKRHKIGAKRIVGGLMSDAERVLSRLVEGRNVDMF